MIPVDPCQFVLILFNMIDHFPKHADDVPSILPMEEAKVNEDD